MQPLNNPDNPDQKLSPDPSNNTKSSTLFQKFCRICFDEESSSSRLISTCKCQGSIKYIHEECLKKWILLRVFDPTRYKCDICKTPLKMELNSKFEPSCERLRSKILRILVIPVIFCIFTNFILLILFLLFVSARDQKVSIFIKIFLFLVLCSCAFIDYALIRKFVKAVKIGCFRRKIIHWKIIENFEDNDLDSTDFSENLESFGKVKESRERKDLKVGERENEFRNRLIENCLEKEDCLDEVTREGLRID